MIYTLQDPIRVTNLSELLYLDLQELDSPVLLLEQPDQLLAVWLLILSKGWSCRSQNWSGGARIHCGLLSRLQRK